MRNADFAELVGQRIVVISGLKVGERQIRIATDKGKLYSLFHSQDCCEVVTLNEISGDPDDLIGSPIVQAEVVSSPAGDPAPECPDSWTWTFYKLSTVKGSVTLRWLGESNGYYSESVDFCELEIPAA